jgi:isoquinoline 1-oxidoreductase beta subunit
MLSGGGFGRRIEPDFTMMAARIAKEMRGTPVKMVWSREEDMRHGYYRPAAAIKLTGGVDASGKLVALRFDSACESLLKYSRFGSMAEYIKPVDPTAIGELPRYYRVPVLPAATTVDAGVPVAFWRSVAASQNTFAYECFIDELAERAKADPVAYRRVLLADDGRERRVLDEAVALAGSLPVGRHRGVAIVQANETCVALVADIAVTGGNVVKVHRICAAIDCGLAVNPNSVRAQVEGGIAFGLSAAFFGEITLDNGAVRQSNFHDYRLVTMAQMPRVDVVIVKRDAKPSGVGEEAVGPVAPAVANAIFAATGKRIRSLPFSRMGLRWLEGVR